LFSPKKAAAAHAKALKPTSDIDDILSGLELRKTPQKVDWNTVKSVRETPEPHRLFEYMSDKKGATNYFDSGSQGKEKSAFLAEVQQYMMDQGTIPKTSYIDITPEMVENTFLDSRFDKEGIGNFLRLFNIMKPTENNYELISKGLNKMLSLAPYAVPAAMSVKALQETPQYQKGGQQVGTDILDKYKSYIMGDYKPEEEKDLKNTYDKLNRHYYKKAKETGKSVPNYIMSLL
jgi:hypothetical protein